MSDTHDCPGGCGEQVPYPEFACKPCLTRLPNQMRYDLTAGYRFVRSQAQVWYRNNPRITDAA